ncbi:MucBP domain-containing protein [Lacticaseibacillus saniviri]
MNLFERVIHFFKKEADVVVPTPPKPHEPSHQFARAETAPLVTPKPQQPAPTATPDRVARITVQFRDRYSDEVLAEPIDYHGEIDEPFKLEWRQFEGRVMSEVVGFTDQFHRANQTIILMYEERLAAPVIIYHRNSYGDLIAPPEMLLGNINTLFVAESLPSQRQHLQGAVEQRGQFQAHSQTIHFEYELNQLETNQPQQVTFVELDRAKPVYREPQGDIALNTELPAHSIWQVFAFARETTNGKVWLNLGGASWITSKYTTPRSDNPYSYVLGSPETPTLEFAEDTSTIREYATVNSTQQGATIWSAPYGNPLTRIPHQTQVVLVRQARLTNDSVWYQLSTGEWIQSAYIALIPPFIAAQQLRQQVNLDAFEA